MSGPKVDYAELREQEMNRLVEARENRLKVADKIYKMMNQIENGLGRDTSLMGKDPQLSVYFKKMEQLQEQCKQELKTVFNTVKRGNETLDPEVQMHQAEEIFKNFKQKINNEFVVVNKLVDSSQQFQQMEQKRSKLANAKRQKIVRVSVEKQAGEKISEIDIKEMVDTFRKEIEKFMLEPMTRKHKNSVLLLNQELQELLTSELDNSRKSARIERLFRDYEKLTDLIRRETTEIEILYNEYRQECFDMDSQPLSMSEFNDSKELMETLHEVRKAANVKLSKEYIRRQIDDVMSKHGYDVVKSDLLHEASQNGQILYGVNDSAAINVFVSDDSQVTMRVVGIGFDSNISESENESLFQEQCAFCSMHPQITAELAMRGVILTTKKHMPPDRKFNKKIVTKTKNSSQTTSRAKKELKRTELKTLHKE